MKIRTDFVTNSSSSSFVVEVEVETTEGERYTFGTRTTDGGVNSNFTCSGKEIANVNSIDALCDLLQESMSGTGKTRFSEFTNEIKENINDISLLESITLRRIWYTMGESSGLTIHNDRKLKELSYDVVSSVGEDKESACKKLEEYLQSAEVYAYGGWADKWPTGFCKNTATPRYKWKHLGWSLEKLAFNVAYGAIDDNDMAVETVFVNYQDKTIQENADFIVDSRGGIDRRPRSKNYFKKIIHSAYPKNTICEKVEVKNLNTDYVGSCDPIDYVMYSDEQPKVAIVIKTSANAKSKTFKAITAACESISLPLAVLDEKNTNKTKILTRINEALFSDVFKKYIVEGSASVLEEADASESETGCSVKVKFGDNRSYEYNCFYNEIHVGDIVSVAGARSGHRGMIMAITSNKTHPGYYNVEKIYRKI